MQLTATQNLACTRQVDSSRGKKIVRTKNDVSTVRVVIFSDINEQDQ